MNHAAKQEASSCRYVLSAGTSRQEAGNHHRVVATGVRVTWGFPPVLLPFSSSWRAVAFLSAVWQLLTSHLLLLSLSWPEARWWPSKALRPSKIVVSPPVSFLRPANQHKMYTYTEMKRTSLLDFSDRQLLGQFKIEIPSNLGVSLAGWGPKSILNLPVELPCTGGDPHSLASSGVGCSQVKQNKDQGRSIRGVVLDFAHWITNPEGPEARGHSGLSQEIGTLTRVPSAPKAPSRGLWVCCLLLGLSRSDLLLKVSALPCPEQDLPCSFLC